MLVSAFLAGCAMTSPAAEDPYLSFYTKQLDAGGIVIRANQVVSDDALT
jgi:hypothetical protein